MKEFEKLKEKVKRIIKEKLKEDYKNIDSLIEDFLLNFKDKELNLNYRDYIDQLITDYNIDDREAEILKRFLKIIEENY